MDESIARNSRPAVHGDVEQTRPVNGEGRTFGSHQRGVAGHADRAPLIDPWGDRDDVVGPSGIGNRKLRAGLDHDGAGAACRTGDAELVGRCRQVIAADIGHWISRGQHQAAHVEPRTAADQQPAGAVEPNPQVGCTVDQAVQLHRASRIGR